MKRLKCPLVRVAFLDHCMTQGDDLSPIPCEVIGYLIKKDKLCLYIASWVCDQTIDSSDTECYSILRSTITRLQYLSPRSSRPGRGKSHQPPRRNK